MQRFGYGQQVTYIGSDSIRLTRWKGRTGLVVGYLDGWVLVDFGDGEDHRIFEGHLQGAGEKPSPAFKKHVAAIKAGEVNKGNIIGMRKLLNGAERRQAGWSNGASTPKGTVEQALKIQSLVRECKPEVDQGLFESGKAVLTNPRYRRRWSEHQRQVIAGLDSILLSDWHWLGRFYACPVYMAIAKDGRYFIYRNVPWQSGGNGPETFGEG